MVAMQGIVVSTKVNIVKLKLFIFVVGFWYFLKGFSWHYSAMIYAFKDVALEAFEFNTYHLSYKVVGKQQITNVYF